jgi:ketosteroid isomerase-like protein
MSLITFERSGPLGLFFLLTLSQLLQPQSFSIAEQEVWERELQYWDFRTSGKIDQYMALWHDDFFGWPAANTKPGGKDDIRKRFESELGNSRPGSFTVKLEPLSVRIYGDVAAVFYRAGYGRVDNTGTRIEAHVRITHTWRRTAGVWKIIAGMSAEDANK